MVINFKSNFVKIKFIYKSLENKNTDNVFVFNVNCNLFFNLKCSLQQIKINCPYMTAYLLEKYKTEVGVRKLDYNHN